MLKIFNRLSNIRAKKNKVKVSRYRHFNKMKSQLMNNSNQPTLNLMSTLQSTLPSPIVLY